MPRYRLKLHKHAVKFLRCLLVRIRQRIREKLDTLVADPFDSGSLDVKPMAGEDGLWGVCASGRSGSSTRFRAICC
jgi:mRNA-degrading endonuclease RelE of RelBE toxin-antitoxin system